MTTQPPPSYRASRAVLLTLLAAALILLVAVSGDVVSGVLPTLGEFVSWARGFGPW